ncbi:MAG: magnesium transporter CorA family protein [Candidatus Gracilibacteria bacterium]|nr:magnesium transporter CorA family protein [Candidatus Gracilibacteria bacterium]MDQ7022707.1 magnesium transporter CorA family protein [Candidatus Gracilibacteria bacterium]
MLNQIKVKGVKWIDGVSLSNSEIEKELKKYDFHELDIEACMEQNQRARIDGYDDYIFMVLHFPKYNQKTKVYSLNEFNIFLGKDFLITFREFEGKNIDKIFDDYKDLKIQDNSEFKITSGYILYEIIQSMLEKMFKFIDNIKKDLKEVEGLVFETANASLVKEIMIKKRNIVIMKHMLLPQVSVMKLIEAKMNEMFKGEMEEYFEDLEDKISKVVNDVRILEEYLDSIEDAFKTIIDIRTNNVMTFLAIFSAFFLPLTLITSFYGMNIKLPLDKNENIIYLFLLFITIIMIFSYLFMKKKGKF